MILKELNHRRLRALEAAKSIANRAESARRGLTAQETQTFDAHFAEAEQLRFLIDQEKRLRSVEDELNKSIQQSPTRSNPLPHELPEYLAAFRALLTGGTSSLTPQQQRSLNAASDTGGGFLLAPAQMAASLVAVVNNTCFVRRMSTVYPLTSAVGINAAALANDVTDPEWTTEVSLTTEDTGLSFGSRELRPHPMSKAVKVSNKLMRSSGLPADV